MDTPSIRYRFGSIDRLINPTKLVDRRPPPLQAGFHEVEAGYIRRQYANRGQGATRRRTWVHARFEKKGGKADGGHE